MPEIKLKPCPFCGSENILVFGGYYNNYVDCIVCNNCKANFKTDKYMTEEQMSEAWNKRAEERTGHWIKKNGMYECSECGVWFPHWSPYCRDCGVKMEPYVDRNYSTLATDEDLPF